MSDVRSTGFIPAFFAYSTQPVSYTHLVYEKTPVLMELVRMYWEKNAKFLPKDPPETWYDTLASIGRKPQL